MKNTADEQSPRVFAIVPAAGRSRRMGSPKQLLAIDGRPMLLAVIDPLAAADVAGVVVVTYRDIAQQLALGALAGVFVAFNEDERSGMVDSVRIGLKELAGRATIGTRDGFLVCPADQPGISTADFDACIAEFRRGPERIVVAVRGKRRWHPIIFPAELASFVESAGCDGGLNRLPCSYPALVVEVGCVSTGVARDIDTRDDYQRLP